MYEASTQERSRRRRHALRREFARRNLFLGYIQEVDTDDQVGLVVYTSREGTAILESPLTDDMERIEDLTRGRQAAHYDNYTNIGAGMAWARNELDRHGRAGAHKMILLMTDGIANRPSNPSVAKSYVREEAQSMADARYPAVTVSLGTGADTGLMQEVADVTGGVHFNVPGGHTVSDYEKQLKDVFRQIAEARPLALVQ